MLHKGQAWADLEFPLAGEYNVWNATAAAALAKAYGISMEEIAAALKTFKSVKRRLEVKAQVNGITIIDDFAHHPTAIAGTLKALRSRYAGARLWAILEPRSNTLRRRVLQSDLARSLALADEVIVAEVFRSEAVPDNERLELPELAADIQRHGQRARLIADADAIVQTIAPEMRSGDVVAILSNGGFGGIYEKLPARLRELAGETAMLMLRMRRGSDEVFDAAFGTSLVVASAVARSDLTSAPCFCVRLLRACRQPTTLLSLANPEQHLVEVQILLPEGAAERELQLPVWNALYQVRDFAQYVNWVRAKDRAGRSLAVRELNKSRWQIATRKAAPWSSIKSSPDSPGPFGAQFDSHHAFFNLAQVLMYPVDARNGPMVRTFWPDSRGMARGHAANLVARRQI